MLGLPGMDTEGGGAFQNADDGRLQRIYHRGTSAYQAARDAGRIQLLPPLTPASPGAVRTCEELLGAPLPRLLRRCYLELGNGDFGPGYGLLPLPEGSMAPAGTLIEAFQKQQCWPEAWQPMAESLLPICEWGCGIASFINYRDPAAPMWAVDPNPDPAGDLSIALFPQHLTFTEWMRRWIEGGLYQPAIIQDETTAQWRPATDADYELWNEES